MPPRRPIAKGADSDARRSPAAGSGSRNAARRPLPAPDREDPGFGEEDSGYRTGSEYPIADESVDPDRPALEGGDDRDIYGEDESFEDDDAYRPSAEQGAPRRSHTRAAMEAVSDDEEPVAEDLGPDATRAGPPVHLDIVEGPDKGKKKRFTSVRLVIGRTPGCELQLSDQSASRRHAELIHSEGGIILRDLGSGNGTKVNGERVGEQVLQHNDVITIGKTKLRFHDDLAAIELARKQEEERAEAERLAREQAEARAKEDAEARAKAEAEAAEARKKREEELAQKRAEREAEEAERRAQRQKILRTVGGTFGTLFVLMLIALVIVRPLGQTADEKFAAEKMELARKAMAEGKHQEAVTLIGAAIRFAPEVDTQGELALAKRELQVDVVLEKARKALDEQRFEDARVALLEMPKDSERGQRELKVLDDERVAREQAVLEAAAEVAIGEGNLEEAQKLLPFLLAGPRAKVEERIAAVEEEREREAAASARQLAAAKAAGARKYAAARRLFLVEAFGPVSLKFHAEDYQRAALECSRVEAKHSGEDVAARSRELQRLIPLFARAYEDGARKISVGNVSGAATHLRKARELYQQVGLPGPLGRKLDRALATSLAAEGQAALGRKDLAAAAVAFRAAMRLDSDASGARDGSAQVQRQAERLYQEAVSLKNSRPESALQKLRVVLVAATPGSTVYSNAQGQIADLEAPLPEDL